MVQKPLNVSKHHDWHPAYVVAALRERGLTLRRLSLDSGYAAQTLQQVLRRPWPKAERIVAAAIGVSPYVIWPSRYNPDGIPNRPRGQRPKRYHNGGTK